MLLEADVDVHAVESALDTDGAPLWFPGPSTVVRRKVASRDAQEVDRDLRTQRLTPEANRLITDDRKRLHRYVRHTFHSVARESADHAFVVTGFELVLADRDTFGHRDAGPGGRTRIPGVVLVHLDPEGDDAVIESGYSSLDRSRIDNVLQRSLLRYRREFCEQIQHQLASPEKTSVLSQNSSTGVYTELGDRSSAAVAEEAAPDILVLGTDSYGVRALQPIYTVMTDVSVSAEQARQRLADDPTVCSEKRKAGYGADEARACPVELLRATRSRALAQLRGSDWLQGAARKSMQTEICGSALDWRDWHASFTPTGAGFAYIPSENASRPHHSRRDDLTFVFADLIALEILKGRVLKGFSDRTHEIAANLVCPEGEFESALDTWKEFAAFTTHYAAGTSDVHNHHEKFLSALRAGLAWNAEKVIERTESNLARLADIARAEQVEQRRRVDAEELEIQRNRDHRERRLHGLVAIVATIFLPLTVIPPILEWFYHNPDPSTAAARAWWTGGGLALFIVGFGVYGLVSRKLSARDGVDHEARRGAFATPAER